LQPTDAYSALEMLRKMYCILFCYCPCHCFLAVCGTVFARHGTRCAGEVAAQANNGICSTGVAYEAGIGG